MRNKESNVTIVENMRSIRDCIFTIRNVQVMLDRDLAELYGVPTRVLNQAVKRNADRFPEGFVFQLTQDEFNGLRSQFVTSNEMNHLPKGVLKSQIVTSKRGGLRYRPYAFTEHGIVMLASLLKSKTASEVSVRIVNTFVAMRKFILAKGHGAVVLGEEFWCASADSQLCVSLRP